MAAITAKLKMRAIRVQPAVGGGAEVVDLVEEYEGPTTNTNLHMMPTSMPKQMRETKLNIDNPVAQGSFVKGQAYKVEFTAISGDVVYGDGYAG